MKELIFSRIINAFRIQDRAVIASFSKMWTHMILPILLLFNFSSYVNASFFRHINAQSQEDRSRRDALLGEDSNTWTPEQFLDDAVDDDELKKVMANDDDNDEDDEVDTVTDSPTFNPLESADDDYYPDPPTTSAPTKAPTPSPTNSPTASPTQSPTINPLESADDDYYPDPPKTSSPSVNPLESADDDYYPDPPSAAFPSSSPSVSKITSKNLLGSESPSSTPSFNDDDDNTSVPSMTPSQNDDEIDTSPPSATPLDQDSSSPSKAPTKAPVHHWPTHPPTIAPTRTPTFMPTSEAWADKVKDEEERLKALAEDRTAEVIAGVIAVLGIIGMLLTAYQLFENPDGLCASCCRLSLKISSFFLKVICLPCRLCCGRYSGYHTSDPENRAVFVEEYTNDLELT